LTAVPPYTAGYAGIQGDVVRFTPSSPHALFEGFSRVDVMSAGGLVQAEWNYLPERLRSLWMQRIVNVLDPRVRTNVTMLVCVFATK
jgi:hypothetical protein